MENKDINAFREVIELLLENSLLLSFKEKKEFSQLLPMLNRDELMELFGLLVHAKKNVGNIIDELVSKYPQVVKELSSYQKNALKTIFKYERGLFKIKLT
ncbi:hypothetical protein J7J83_01885 [bacterium]|nr:hypothetical protein [bacterium]